MNTIKCSLLTAFALTSCMSLSHDIASQLPNAQKTKRQVKIEEQIAAKKSDLKFNAGSSVIGIALFALGTKSIQNPDKIDLLALTISSALIGGGMYFGLHDMYTLYILKNKLEACAATQKSS